MIYRDAYTSRCSCRPPNDVAPPRRVVEAAATMRMATTCPQPCSARSTSQQKTDEPLSSTLPVTAAMRTTTKETSSRLSRAVVASNPSRRSRTMSNRRTRTSPSSHCPIRAVPLPPDLRKVRRARQRASRRTAKRPSNLPSSPPSLPPVKSDVRHLLLGRLRLHPSLNLLPPPPRSDQVPLLLAKPLDQHGPVPLAPSTTPAKSLWSARCADRNVQSLSLLLSPLLHLLHPRGPAVRPLNSKRVGRVCAETSTRTLFGRVCSVVRSRRAVRMDELRGGGRGFVFSLQIIVVPLLSNLALQST